MCVLPEITAPESKLKAQLDGGGGGIGTTASNSTKRRSQLASMAMNICSVATTLPTLLRQAMKQSRDEGNH
jgi:hypothetical protein